MSDVAKGYLDSFTGLLEGLKEFESHTDFATRLDDLIAIERQRSEIIANFIADFGNCIQLDHRVINPLVTAAEEGRVLEGLEAASKAFRTVYEGILEAEEAGVSPLQQSNANAA